MPDSSSVNRVSSSEFLWKPKPASRADHAGPAKPETQNRTGKKETNVSETIVKIDLRTKEGGATFARNIYASTFSLE